MKKFLVKILICLLAVTSVFGLTTMSSVQASGSETISGVVLEGAGLRIDPEDSDLSGLRFKTTVTDEALEAILAKAQEQGETKFSLGVEITDADGTSQGSDNSVMDFNYITLSDLGEETLAPYKGSGTFTYYVAVTFNEAQFASDVEALLLAKNLLTAGQADYDAKLADYVATYKALSYAELLTAKCYYKIGEQKYYTDTLTRSMRIVANYYDKNPELLEELGLYENFVTVNNAKHFVITPISNSELSGYLYINEGKATISADSFEPTVNTRIAYNQRSVPCTFENNELLIDPTELSALLDEGDSLTIGSEIVLYAFNENNEVTTLTLNVVNVLNAYLSYDVDDGVTHKQWSENGEIVGTGLTGANIPDTSNYSYYIGETNVSGQINGDKILLNEEALKTVTLPSLCENVDVKVVNAENKLCYLINCKYVSLAIDEPSDLNKFDVGYTYNRPEYATVRATFEANPDGSDSDVIQFLTSAQANPYDYYDGYYVLVSDINAEGIEFTHEAAFAVSTKHKATAGFAIDETNNCLTPQHDNARITYSDAVYDIPRVNYPAIKDCDKGSSDYWISGGAYFYKMGLLGTFDGQGYVIDNINVTRDVVSYLVGDEASNAGINYGAGILGVINGGSQVINVAITNVNYSNYSLNRFGSAFALLDVNPRTSSITTEKDIIPATRTLFSNIYVESNTSEYVSGGLYGFTAGTQDGRGTQLNNVIINLPNLTSSGYNLSGGGYGNAIGGTYPFSGYSNTSFTFKTKNVYIATGVPAATISNTNISIVYGATMEEIFTKTVDFNNKAVDPMATVFADSEYFTVGADRVYWHSLAP